jgi:hypothetical protein
MALLEYATHTVPDVVKKAVPSFFWEDPLMKAVKSRGGVKRSGGTHVRFKRIISGHSDVTQIDASNMSVPLAKKQTFTTMTGDWGRLIKPVILPHYDLNRLGKADEKKQYIKDVVTAALTSLRNDFCRRFYIGDTPSTSLSAIGSLNGGRSASNNSNGTSSGLTNGALEFDTPATQATNGNTYLNDARVDDSTAADENNHHNQFVQHGGIGTNFMTTTERIKLRADSYAEKGGIEIVILSIDDQVAVADEIRALSGSTASPLVYTMQDWDKGNIHKPIVAHGGMRYYSNRWMSAARMGNYAGSAGNINEAAFLLNPDFVEYWVNAGEDFRVGKFFDGMEHGNQDALIAYIFLEIQAVLVGLLNHGCTRAA